MLSDLLVDVVGQVILDLPLAQRRALPERLLADAPAQLALAPQTADVRQASNGW